MPATGCVMLFGNPQGWWSRSLASTGRAGVVCDRAVVAVLAMASDVTAASQGRRLVRGFGCGHPAELVDAAVLVVSELVTNAVRRGAPPVTVRVECETGRALQIGVTDTGPGLPTPVRAGSRDDGGRSLMIVDALSAAHGVEVHASTKTVWARLAPGC